MMDLVTLVTVCALGVDPKLMHALIWHQSGGEPWSFSLPGEALPRVYSTMRQAIGEAQAMRPDGGMIRVGLTGLSVRPPSATAAMFSPCANIATAAREIALLTEHCNTLSRFKGDPTFCAIALYRGSLDRPDTKFADAVRTSVARSDAPNFDMPKDTGVESIDIASEKPPLHQNAASPEPALASDDRERGWSSALFPSKPQRSDGASTDDPVGVPPAEKSQSFDAPRTRPSTTKPPTGGLFVPRSSEQK